MSSVMLSFYDWLIQQVGRDDHVADLARDAREDARFPRSEQRYDALQRYLLSRNACGEAQTALAKAYREWRKAKVRT